MATKAQLEAARANIKKAQAASRKQRTLALLPEGMRRGKLARPRAGEPGRALEDRNSQQLYALAREHRIAGRSAMGKHELIAAIRKKGAPSSDAKRSSGSVSSALRAAEDRARPTSQGTAAPHCSSAPVPRCSAAAQFASADQARPPTLYTARRSRCSEDRQSA